MSATRSGRRFNRRPGPLVRLWLLRIPDNAAAHRQFINAHAFDSDEAARAPGNSAHAHSAPPGRIGTHTSTGSAIGINEMLTCMERFAGIFIASTNRMDGLDAAALRRFDARIHFGFLRPEQVRAMLHAHCQLLGLPAPGTAEERAVAGLHALAPGDFAALTRQHRFRPIGSPARLVELLQAECAQTRGAPRPIGFVR